MKSGGLKLNMNFNVSPTSVPVLPYVIKIVMVIFGAVTAVKALADPCCLSISVMEVLFVVIPVLAVGLLLRLIPVRFKWIRILCGFVLSVMYIMRLGIEEIYYGANCIVTRLMEEQYAEVDAIINAYGDYRDYQYVAVTVSAIAFVSVLLLFVSTISSANMGLQILATLPLYSVSYIVGMKPGSVVFQMLAFYIACYCMARSEFTARYLSEKEIEIYEEQSTKHVVGQIIVIMTSVFMILWVVYSFVTPESKYKKPKIIEYVYEEIVEKTIEYVKENIENMEDKIDEGDLPDKEAISGFSDGNLGDFDKINLSNVVQLVLRDVSVNINGTIYLRGKTADRYYSGVSRVGGRSYWDDGTLTSIKTLNTVYDEKIYIRLGNYTYKVLDYHNENRDDVVTGSMTVEKINRAEKSYFEPPYTLSSMEREYDLSFDEENNYENNIELMVAHMNMGPFTRALMLGGQPMTDFYVMGTAFLESEEGRAYKYEVNTYNSSVYSAYTHSNADIIDTLAQYPEYDKFNNIVDDIRRKDAVTPEENVNRLDAAISAIMVLLSDCRYTLAPGATPDNVDFVGHFLIDTKKGYCTHFASAMAVILQELGHPARYVTGYMVDTPSNIEAGASGKYSVSVTQESAHAWVEVYVENFGWVTIEPTAAAYTGGFDGDGFDIIIDEDMVIDDNVVTTPDNNDKNDNDDKDQDKDDKEKDKKKSFKFTKKAKIVIAIIMAVAVVALIIFITIKRRKWKQKETEKLLASDNPEEKFKGLWKISKDLFALTKAPELFKESRSDTAEGIYNCVYNTINRKELTKKRPALTEPILTKSEYLYLIDVLSEGIYDKKLPDNKKMETSADFVIYTTEILYGERGKLSQFFLKYIKCLYLK